MKILKTALSLSTPDEWKDALLYNADFREIRIDMIKSPPLEDELLNLCKKNDDDILSIATIRSEKEGGCFLKNREDWREKIDPWLNYVDYVDIERDFSGYAPEIRKGKTKVISSVHLNYMPGYNELKQIEKELRQYGDIPKIVVTPENEIDIASFIEFTVKAEKPVITSVMGVKFKKARIPLLILGSMLIYCHCGTQASKGQYHIRDVKTIINILEQK